MFRWFSRQSPRPSAARKSRRPELEALEDRCVPSLGSPVSVSSSTRLDTGPATGSAADPKSGTTYQVVAWSQASNLGDLDVLVKAGVDGNLPSTPQVVANTGDDEDQADVAVAPNGNYVVVWRQNVNGSNSDIHYTLFSSGGAALITGTINQTNGQEFDPHVAMDSQGRFIVAYTAIQQDTFRRSTVVTDNVVAVLFDANGNQRDIARVATKANKDEIDPRVDMAPNGRFVISYFQSDVGAPTSHQSLRSNSYAITSGTFFKIQLVSRTSVTSQPRRGALINHDVSITKGGSAVEVYIKQLKSGTQEIAERKVSFTGGAGGEKLLENTTGALGVLFGSGLSVGVNDVTGAFVIAFRAGITSSSHSFVDEFDRRARPLGVPIELDSVAGSSIGTGDASVSIDDLDDKSAGRLDNYFVAYHTNRNSGDIDAAFGTIS